MIATLLSWPYGNFKDGTQCVVLGFKEDVGGAIHAIAADLKTGELSVVDLKDVTIDCAKLRKLPAL